MKLPNKMRWDFLNPEHAYHKTRDESSSNLTFILFGSYKKKIGKDSVH